MLKVLPWQHHPASVSEFVRERYEEVFSWCLQVTGNDVPEAEDLIQDAYLLLRHSSISAGELHNIEGYIYVVLRNLHRSRYERKRRHVPIPILDYDCARIGLATTDSSHLLEVADQLRSICRFACDRKEKSRAGSVLILRFFHGYYPSEIAAILLTSREAVDEHLRTVRKEASDSLVGTAKPILASSAESTNIDRSIGVPTAETLLDELRRSILASCSSPCPSPVSLARYYQPEAMAPLPTRLLAHIVSCSQCLEQVNRLLNLSSLNSRDPSDSAGKQSDKSLTSLPRKQRRNKSPMQSARAALLERLTGDLYEHRPESLCVAVNGQPMVLQRITGSDFEITVKLHQSTGIDFIEVFSEQDIRLLMIPIFELPPDGPFKQSAVTRFSDNRELSATFSYTSPWPSVHVSYHTDLPIPVAALGLTESADRGMSNRWFEQSLSPRRRWSWRPIWNWTGTTLSFLAISLYLVEQSRFGTAEAKALLEDSVTWENSVRTAGPNVVRQRFQFKEKYAAKQKIVEVWRGLGRQSRYLRLLDESGTLLATSDTKPIREQAKQPEKLWQFEPSAETFFVFAQPEERLKATKRGDMSEIEAGDITLVLHRESGRPVREVLRVDGRQFEFSETTFDIVPAAGSPIPTSVPPTERPRPLDAILQPRRRDTPTPEQLQFVELQARTALHKVGADLRENPQIRQLQERVTVDLVVDTRERRNEIQHALAQIPLLEPRFRVIADISGQIAAPSLPAPVQHAPVDRPQVRYQPLMQEYLQKQLGSALAANHVAETAARADDELMRRSVALSQLADRYGTEELAALPPHAKRELIRLVDSNLDQLETAHKNFKGIVLDLVRPVARTESAEAGGMVHTAARDWPGASKDLLNITRQIHAICSTLFVETTRKPEDSLANLAYRLSSLGEQIQPLMQDMRATLTAQATR